MPVKKAVIPAAGFGTRLLPLTKSIPKEMLLVDEKPVIQHVVEEALNAGIEDILIITGEGEEYIKKHFGPYEHKDRLVNDGKYRQLEAVEEIERLGEHIQYRRQEEQKGLGDAVMQAEDFVDGEDFAILFGDSFFRYGDNLLEDMVDVYEEYGANVAGATEYREEELSSHGILDVKEVDKDRGIYEIRYAVEKPHPDDAPSNIGISSRYIISSEIFDSLREIDPDETKGSYFTDAVVNNLEKEGERTLAYISPYKRYHMTRPRDYRDLK